MQRLLIIGCGDVARRALPWLRQRFRVYGLARQPEQAQALSRLGVIPVPGDLDHRASLRRLAGLASHILHCAPPPGHGQGDTRTANLLAALAARSLPRHLVYISTTGVYGDCGGARVDESHPSQPQSTRAQRRQAAEQGLRQFGQRNGVGITLLRAPGIYAANRLPLDRLRNGTPAICHAEDSHSNHIHADDLAHACCLALFRGAAGRAYNICDDADWTMGEWFDRVADATGLPRPARWPRAKIQAMVSPLLWSFLRESRRLSNRRMKEELGLKLTFPTPQILLDQAFGRPAETGENEPAQ